jgi:hypothetical protein
MTNNNAPPEAVIDKAISRSNVAKELGFGAVNKYVAKNRGSKNRVAEPKPQ